MFYCILNVIIIMIIPNKFGSIYRLLTRSQRCEKYKYFPPERSRRRLHISAFITCIS